MKRDRPQRVKYLDYARLVLFNWQKNENKVSRSTIRSKHKTEYRQSKSWYDTSCKWDLSQKQKGGVYLPVQYHIYSRETFQSGSPFKDQGSWRKCRQSPSTDIQWHRTCILNQHDCFMRGCIAPSVVSKKNAIKQKCRRLTRQTATCSSYQVRPMLNEKCIIIPWVATFDGLYIDMLPPQDWRSV